MPDIFDLLFVVFAHSFLKELNHFIIMTDEIIKVIGYSLQPYLIDSNINYILFPNQ